MGEDGSGGAEVWTSSYNGLPLSDLTSLEYSTYVTQNNSGQAPYIILYVDLDGNGTADDSLFFEPVYQTGTSGDDPVPDQGDVTVGEWQTWDARAGGWWSFNAGAFGPPLVTLDSYLAAHPGARLATDGASLLVVAGYGAGAWDNFVGNVDCVTVGAAGVETTYDFEPTPTTTVDVGGVDSGVVNRIIGPGGRTLQDTVAKCAVGVQNHGQFVSCVAHLANELRKADVITNAENSALKQAAARSDVGKKKK